MWLDNQVKWKNKNKTREEKGASTVSYSLHNNNGNRKRRRFSWRCMHAHNKCNLLFSTFCAEIFVLPFEFGLLCIGIREICTNCIHSVVCLCVPFLRIVVISAILFICFLSKHHIISLCLCIAILKQLYVCWIGLFEYFDEVFAKHFVCIRWWL